MKSQIKKKIYKLIQDVLDHKKNEFYEYAKYKAGLNYNSFSPKIQSLFKKDEYMNQEILRCDEYWNSKIIAIQERLNYLNFPKNTQVSVKDVMSNNHSVIIKLETKLFVVNIFVNVNIEELKVIVYVDNWISA